MLFVLCRVHLEYVSIENMPFILLIKYVSYCFSNDKIRYYKFPRIRYNDEVPKDIMIIIRGLAKSKIKDRLSFKECYHHYLSTLDNENYDNECNSDDGVINDNNTFDFDVITYLKSSTTSITSAILLLILAIVLPLLKKYM